MPQKPVIWNPQWGEASVGQASVGPGVNAASVNKSRRQWVQAKATLSSDFGPNFSDERATIRPPSAR